MLIGSSMAAADFAAPAGLLESRTIVTYDPGDGQAGQPEAFAAKLRVVLAAEG